MDIFKTMKNEIESSSETRRNLAHKIGVDPVILHRIVHGGTCTAKTCEIILSYFGYTLTKRTRAQKGR